MIQGTMESDSKFPCLSLNCQISQVRLTLILSKLLQSMIFLFSATPNLTAALPYKRSSTIPLCVLLPPCFTLIPVSRTQWVRKGREHHQIAQRKQTWGAFTSPLCLTLQAHALRLLIVLKVHRGSPCLLVRVDVLLIPALMKRG